MDDWTKDPDTRAWLDHVRDELIPMIRQTAMTISLIPSEGTDVDIKFAVELGLSIMLGKPIIVVLTPGRQIPDGLARVADEIIEWDGTGDPSQSQALVDAIKRIGERHA